jgi:hypothetical protein
MVSQGERGCDSSGSEARNLLTGSDDSRIGRHKRTLACPNLADRVLGRTDRNERDRTRPNKALAARLTVLDGTYVVRRAIHVRTTEPRSGERAAPYSVRAAGVALAHRVRSETDPRGDRRIPKRGGSHVSAGDLLAPPPPVPHDVALGHAGMGRARGES